MFSHHLRQIRDLCGYRVTGIGTGTSELSGLVFDAAEWQVRSFVVRLAMSAVDQVVMIPRACFRNLDDAAGQLALQVRDELPEPARIFRPDALAGTARYDATDLIGRPIEGEDGRAGRVVDFLVNVEFWQLRYFVIATGKRLVLTDVEWASSLASGSDEIRLDLPADAIASAPPYEGLGELCSGYEEALYRHYTSSVAADCMASR